MIKIDNAIYNDYVGRIVPDAGNDYYHHIINEKVFNNINDASLLGLSIDDIYLMIKYEVGNCYKIDSLDKDKMNDYLSRMLNNLDILNINPTSEILCVIKNVLSDYQMLINALIGEKHYAAVKRYKGIIDKLNKEALGSYDELKYRYHAPYDSIKNYDARINDFKYNNRVFDVSYTYKYNYSRICLYIQRYLYEIMKNYYDKYKVFYKQVDDNLEMYIFKGYKIITYKYDDYMNVLYDKYDPTRYQFWASMYKDFDLKKLSIKPKDNVYNAYFVPSGYLDEAIYRISNDNKDMDSIFGSIFLESISYDNSMIDSRLLYKDRVYFKDYRDVSLVFKEENPYLEKLKEKDNYKEMIVRKYKGDMNKSK